MQRHRLRRERCSQHSKEMVHEDEEDDLENLPDRHGSAANKRKCFHLRGAFLSAWPPYGLRYVQAKTAEKSYFLHQSCKRNNNALSQFPYV